MITGAQGYKLIQRSFSSQIYDDGGDGEEDDDDDGGGGDGEEDWENNKYILWRNYDFT